MKRLGWAILLLCVVQLCSNGPAEAAKSQAIVVTSIASLPSPIPARQSPAPHFQSPIPNTTFFVARVYFASRTDLPTLTSTLDIWEVNHDAGYVVAMITEAQWSWLKLLGYRVEVDAEKPAALNRPLVRSAGQTRGIPGYACYRTVEETYQDLAALALNFPNLAEWSDIGDTYDKVTAGGPTGYDIGVLVLTNKASTTPKAKFLLLAAVHAREFTTAELATRFAEKLVTQYGTDPDVTWLLDYNEIHIIAQGNPDGRKWAEQGYSWRKNTDRPGTCGFPSYGVDLNRNGSFLWSACPSGCSSSDPCSIVYRGASPGSEPETQAVETYMQSIFPDQRDDALADPVPLDATGLFISLHSYGNLVIYPWDWTGQDAPNMLELRRLGRKFGYFNRYSVCNTSNCLYAVDGSHTDFAYGNFGVATYTFEIGTAFFQSCSYFENNILQSNLKALYYAAKAARRPYQTPAGPDTLDVIVSPQTVRAGAAVALHANADDTRTYSNGYGTEPAQPVAATRYTVDVPSWASETNAALTAVDGDLDETVERVEATLDTTGWSRGRHTIFVESQDSDGNWGVPTAVFLWIDATHALDLAQPASTALVTPGGTATYTLTVTNVGNAPDSFDLKLFQSDWVAQFPGQVGPLAVDESQSVAVQVSVPATATTGASNVTIIEVTSQGDAAQTRVATLQTVVDVKSDDTSSSADPLPLYLPSIQKE